MLEKLMKCLDAYQSCINAGEFDTHYIKAAMRVNETTTLLKNQIEINECLNNFDFISLKKDVAAVFHPDRYSNTNEFISDSNETFGIFNGNIDDVIKYINSGNRLIPSDHISKKSEEVEKKQYRPNSNCNARQRKENVQEETEEQYVFYDDISSHYSIFEKVSAFIDKLIDKINDVPKTEDEYVEILEKYNKRISTLNESISYYRCALRDITVTIRQNNIDKVNSIDEDTISCDYIRLLNNLWNEANRYYCQSYTISRNLNSRFTELAPIINAQVNEWFKEYETIVAKYNRLCCEFDDCEMNGNKSRSENLRKKLQKLDTYITKTFDSKSQGIIETVKQRVLNGDKVYSSLLKDYNAMFSKHKQADARYKQASSNPDEEKRKIKEEKELEYYQKEKKLSKKAVAYKNTIDSLEKKKEKAEQEKEIFVNMYSEQFAPKMHAKKK